MTTVPFKAVVLAAGMGTRMKSELPKVLHEVADEPMVVRSIRLALDRGADEVAVVVGYKKDLVEDAVRTAYPDAPISFHVQHAMNGTADAVNSARAAYAGYDGAVLILYGDVPNLPGTLIDDVVDAWQATPGPLALVTGIDPGEHQYGRIVRDADGRPHRIVEFKDADDAVRAVREVNIGVYLVAADFLVAGLDSTTASETTGEFYLTDLVEMAYDAGTPAASVVSDDIDALHGVNTLDQLAAADALARARA